MALGLHLNAFDRLTGSDPSADLEHSVLGASSASHNASFQEVTFPTSFIDSRGVPSQSSVDCGAFSKTHRLFIYESKKVYLRLNFLIWDF